MHLCSSTLLLVIIMDGLQVQTTIYMLLVSSGYTILLDCLYYFILLKAKIKLLMLVVL